MEPKPKAATSIESIKEEEPYVDQENAESSATQQEEQKMELNIKSLVGKSAHKIVVPTSSTVGHLKRQIECQHRINFRHQTLIFGDRVLVDTEKLTNHKIAEGNTLFIVPKMRSGPLDFKVDTKALEKFVKEIDSRVNQICEMMKNKTNAAPLTKKDMAMLVPRSDGSYKLVIVNAENQCTISELGTNDDVVEDESNDKTREKMNELRKKMQESKERRQKKKHKKDPLNLNKDVTLEHVSLEFADAEAIIDEKDWNNLVRIMSGNRVHKQINGKMEQTIKEETVDETKVGETKKKQIYETKNKEIEERKIIEQKSAENDNANFSEQVSTIENDKSKIDDQNKPNVIKASATIDTDIDSESEDKSEKESSEFEGFFDCQDIESDDAGLWKGFVGWLYQSVFHHKLKHLSEHPE